MDHPFPDVSRKLRIVLFVSWRLEKVMAEPFADPPASRVKRLGFVVVPSAMREKYAAPGVDEPMVGGLANRDSALLGVRLAPEFAGCNTEKF